MVFFGKRKRELSRRLVIVLISAILTGVLLSAQDNSPEQEEPRITVEVSPEKIIVGQRFDLTIFGDFPSYRNVAIKEPPLPDGIALVGGPYKSAQTVRVGDMAEARYIKKTRIYYKFKVDKPGIYTMGSFILSDGETTLETDSVTFPAVAFDERSFKYPVFANWYSLPDEVMVGETIPLILEMVNLESLTFPDSVQIDPPAGGMFERVNALGEITVKEIGDDEVYLAPIESWLYTPTAAGRIKIPAASVKMGNIVRSTDSHMVNVVSSPIEIQATGAIGSFSLSVEVENLPPLKGQESLLRVLVEGEGNLNYLIMPVPEFSGISLIDKEEISDYVPSRSGYSGYREDVYRLQVGDDANLTIDIPPWSWYNRSAGTVETERTDLLKFSNVFFREETEEPSFGDQFELLSADEVTNQRKPFYNIAFYYLLMLPGVISVLTALIRKHYDARLSAFSLLLALFISSSSLPLSSMGEELEKAERLFAENRKEESLAVYSGLISENETNSALYFNQALIEHELGKKGNGVYSLRKALNLKPGSRLYQKALASVEREYGLERQVRATSGLSPDLFFLLFLILFNGGALIISFNIRKRKMELTILVIMVFFASLVSLGIVFYSHFISVSETAVVTVPEGELKKVPGGSGGSWLSLQEGTAVLVLSRSGDSLLIRTGYGLEGWIDESSLLFLNGEN
ncbi:MAG: BatD family protein [Spirochaetales bacterium]|nr:BatD family protein [Spirochaetales bacterium]